MLICNCALPAIRGNNDCCKSCPNNMTGDSNNTYDIVDLPFTYQRIEVEETSAAKLKELQDRIKEFVKLQVDLDPELQSLVDKHFWELV